MSALRLTREGLERLGERHHRLAMEILYGLGRELAMRLREANRIRAEAP